MRIWRNDLSKQSELLLDELLKETRDVLLSGRYLLGDRLARFESSFAEYCGLKHAVGVASGTEAIYLALISLGIKQGDEVITSPFTFIGTVSAILMTGATPIFADIDSESFNLNPDLVESKITPRTRVIMPVHLYGQIAEMSPLIKISTKHGLRIVEDAAQAHGSLYKGLKAGHFGDMACYSFYPSKNLGAYGDAGAVVTNDENLDQQLRLLRNYGQEKVYHTKINGINSRLDELQAAFLSAKLKYLDQWNEQRRKLANLYEKNLSTKSIQIPVIGRDQVTNYHVYVIRAMRRDDLQTFLDREGIQTNVYYPVPLHLQKSNAFLGHQEGDFPEAERACREVLALPMYPEMDPKDVKTVSDTVNEFYSKD